MTPSLLVPGFDLFLALAGPIGCVAVALVALALATGVTLHR